MSESSYNKFVTVTDDEGKTTAEYFTCPMELNEFQRALDGQTAYKVWGGSVCQTVGKEGVLDR